MFRALAARCSYLSLDRPDIALASKELCRDIARPTSSSVMTLKHLVRYLHHHPRMVYAYPFAESECSRLDIHVDTEFAGCV